MTTLKDIKGDQIRYLDEDPVVQGLAGGTWSSGGSLNTASREGGGSGTQTDAINVGGYPYPMTNENYNGTSWATFTNLNTQRGKNATSGSFPNAITAAGATPTTPGYGTLNVTESWNGSAWTEVADLSSIREAYAMSANGTNTATILFGGVYSGPSEKALTESWNGTSWTEVNDLNTARFHLSGIGTQTDALAVGGSTATPAVPTANTETWNGTSWTEVNNLNTSRRAAAASSGTSTNALNFGGFITTAQAVTEAWDGTSWTEVADLSTARYFFKGAGSGSSSALAFGGLTPTETSATEEWTTAPSASLALQEGMMWFNSTSQTLKGYGLAAGLPAGTWASGGNLPSPTSQNASSGASTSSALNFGGTNTSPSPTSQIALTQTYDGTSWTEVNDLNTARRLIAGKEIGRASCRERV